MIEQLPFTEIHSGGGEHMADRVEFRPVSLYEMQHKINEIVSAVNELTSCVGQLGVEFTDETHAENVPQLKLYVCPDGSVYDNEDVAKSHTASIFNSSPAGSTTTDRVYLEQKLERTRKALDVAVDALKEINHCALDFTRARDALKQITTLEQKDVK